MRINGKDYRSVWFEQDRLIMIDQNKIPHEFALKEYSTYLEVATAIRDMTDRKSTRLNSSHL